MSAINRPTRILFVSQEMKPYVEFTKMAEIARKMPQAMVEKGMEIRVLMPRFGTINERRHRLHEVVRLSGINIMLGDTDNPLLIKVASLPGTRMQVYFLDNEDFFHRKSHFVDAKEQIFDDNHQRMVFFCKGVLETVTKLGWAPDIIHCQGWFTSLIPMYIKRLYEGSPIYKNTKVVYSLYPQESSALTSPQFLDIGLFDHMKPADLEPYQPGTHVALDKGACFYSDAIIEGTEDVDPEIKDYIHTLNDKATLGYVEPEEVVEPYHELYRTLLATSGVLA